MKTLNEILQSETETNIFVFEERLKGTDMDKLLDYIRDQTVENLSLKVGLYQFVRAVYNTPLETVKEELKNMNDMELDIQEINSELEKISKEHSKLYDREQKLNDERQKLLAKDICKNKYFSKCKWKAKERSRTGFILRPIIDHDDQGFDHLQTKLRLYPHGSFELNENIELCGSDGDFYIMSSDTKAGMEFIKSQNMEIVIDQSIIEDIASMEKQIVLLKEFINQFGMMVKNNKEETR